MAPTSLPVRQLQLQVLPGHVKPQEAVDRCGTRAARRNLNVVPHTTTLMASLSIMASGAIRPSPGNAGNGVYSFACDSDQDSTALDATWSRGARGQYNEGALFVFRAYGILAAAKNSPLTVPLGATARKGDQYSSHLGVIEYMSFTTTEDGWLGELSQQLDAHGYTQALHDALMAIKTHMETETVSKSYDAVFLKNRFVTQKPKLVVPPHVDLGHDVNPFKFDDDYTQTPKLVGPPHDDWGHDVNPFKHDDDDPWEEWF